MPIAVTCRVLGFSKQAFHRWDGDPISQRDWDDAWLLNEAVDIHRMHPEYGYRRVAAELTRRGHIVGEQRVMRLCRDQGLVSTSPDRRRAAAAAPLKHLPRIGFRADALDNAWAVGMVDVAAKDGRLVLCVIKDWVSNRIVGYSVQSATRHRRSDIVLQTLRTAARDRRPLPGLMVLSNGDADFRTVDYQRVLARSGMVDMRWNVHATDPIFRILRHHVVAREWQTRAHAHSEIVRLIEASYRTIRFGGLGGLTSIEYETMCRGLPLRVRQD